MSTPRDATSLRLSALGPTVRPVPPVTVRRATIFICAGAALAIAAGVFDAIAIRDQAAATLPAHASPAFGVIDGLILATLWLWMAWKTGTGRNWARIVSTVFFGLLSVYCGKFAIDLSSVTSIKADTAGYLGATFLEWIVGLVALILLWQHRSGKYFAIRAQAKASASAWHSSGNGGRVRPSTVRLRDHPLAKAIHVLQIREA